MTLKQCVVCGKETNKTLFKNAVVQTYICSKECLAEYFKPLGRTVIQERLNQTTEDKEYWLI